MRCMFPRQSWSVIWTSNYIIGCAVLNTGLVATVPLNLARRYEAVPHKPKRQKEPCQKECFSRLACRQQQRLPALAEQRPRQASPAAARGYWNVCGTLGSHPPIRPNEVFRPLEQTFL